MHVTKHIISMDDEDTSRGEVSGQPSTQVTQMPKATGDDKSGRKKTSQPSSSPQVSHSPQQLGSTGVIPPPSAQEPPPSPVAAPSPKPVTASDTGASARVAADSNIPPTSMLSTDVVNRPWTTRPDNSNVPDLAQAKRAEEHRQSDAHPLDREVEAVARWVNHLRQEGGKTFNQGLVDQHHEDEAGRTFGDVFPSLATEEVAEEFPTANRNCQGPCHPLCHVRPMRAVTRSNQLSQDNPFIASGYQEIASQRCNYPDLPENSSRTATKLYHLTHGDVLVGDPGDPETRCPMCRDYDPLLPPFGQECCTLNWNRFHRLARVSASAASSRTQVDGMGQQQSPEKSSS